MFDLPPILISGITGFISGLVLAVPVGPVNLAIMNEGARRGFKYAALISSGALLMEFIYCALAFTGFAGFFRGDAIKHLMEVFSFGFILVLGMIYLFKNTVTATTRVEAQLEEKFHPHSAFMTGFVRVLGNLGVFGGWILLGSAFVAHGWVQPNLECKATCVAGVTVGTGVWFFGLGYAVSLGHRKFSEKTLLRMQRGSGIGLIILALAQGIKIAWQLNKARGGS